MRRFSVIVLAAGGASRMGRPKQLVRLDGVTLVERAVQNAFSVDADEVVVVLGAAAEEVAGALDGQPVRLTVNVTWQDGLGSSIAQGVRALSPCQDAAILTLADQPFVSADHLRKLAATPGDIVATEWSEGFGSPCLFEKCHFAELGELTGDRGAKQLIQRHGAVRVRLDAAAIDVDTPEDVVIAERHLSLSLGDQHASR